MFKLYFFTDRYNSSVVFTNDELAPCLTYIRTNRLNPQSCMIITPNNRRVTFNSNNDMVFSKAAA